MKREWADEEVVDGWRGRTGPPELSLTGQNEIAEAVTSHLNFEGFQIGRMSPVMRMPSRSKSETRKNATDKSA
ncbi:hypothetical protein EVAR_43471_1 [Eumeta japonica]|uniref:Uncharacterized protein n=1 Tax=Eumeta variegata TaxID=151549 RepID=A0A4C1Z4W9_EUMVA|nr:hypothetical protein EVAR_43471_1 [Eumeta japonica]